MTIDEAKKMLEAKLECLKHETSGTDYACNQHLCEGCSLNYEQGNMGEQKEALEMATKALEQQPITWIVGKDNCQVAVRNMPIDKMQKICAIIGEKEQQPKTIQEKQAESEKYQKAFDDGYENGYAQARFDYEQQPKTGYWIAMSEGFTPYECSECESVEFKKSKYCPECGAKMDADMREGEE